MWTKTSFHQDLLLFTAITPGWVLVRQYGHPKPVSHKKDRALAQPNLEEIERSPQEILLADILQRLDDAGDLPIFSASVNRVQVVGSDPDADAVALAEEVLKDANLTTKILKMANSSYYSRGGSKVGALSRAIVVLGFNLLKTTVLTMKFIDSFQAQQSNENIERMLVKAYMSAGFVKEMAEVVGVKNVEQSYVCGLLHNMGEVILASVMPEKYAEIQSLVENNECTWVKAQNKVLGMSLQQIGQSVMEKWEFPDSVSKTMVAPKGRSKGKIKGHIEFNRSLSSLTNDMMDLIYSENPVSTRSFTELTKEMVDVTGLNNETVAASLDAAFKQSCELAESYGLDKKHLRPNVSATCGVDKLRDEMIKSLSRYIDPDSQVIYEEDEEPDEDDGYDNEPTEECDEAINCSNKAGVADTNTLLDVIQQITAFITQKAPLNTVFGKVLEGITQGVGFDRALLCLITPDRKSYSSRIAAGNKSDIIRKMFHNRRLDVKHDLFSKVIVDGGDILVANSKALEWSKLLTQTDLLTLDTSGFFIVSLQVQGKPVGFFYGDKIVQKTNISAEEVRGFIQLVAQAQLALQVR